MKAYQIVDFNNPVSVNYYKYSVSSFAPVKDLLDIEQVQCIVPATLPSNINFDPKKKRSDTEKAVLASHYMLIKRLAVGEKFIIMEHDAYLWPEKVELFRTMLDKISTTAVWISGIAVECYTMSQEVAKRYCELMENDSSHNRPGPMSILHTAGNDVCLTKNTRVVWPLYGETGKLVFAENVNLASAGKGKTNDAPVTQYVNLNAGVTVERKNRPITKENNPNVFFGDD